MGGIHRKQCFSEFSASGSGSASVGVDDLLANMHEVEEMFQADLEAGIATPAEAMLVNFDKKMTVCVKTLAEGAERMREQFNSLSQTMRERAEAQGATVEDFLQNRVRPAMEGRPRPPMGSRPRPPMGSRPRPPMENIASSLDNSGRLEADGNLQVGASGQVGGSSSQGSGSRAANFGFGLNFDG